MRLSKELRKFPLIAHDDPVSALETLTQKAQTLEAIAAVHDIVSDYLGQALIDEILKIHIKQLEQAGYKSEKTKEISSILSHLMYDIEKKNRQ